MNEERNILCFGDSNTWGTDPAGGPRFDRKTRWPCILQNELGAGYHVVEAGLCGRTTVWDDPIEGHKNGLQQLIPILKSHEPLDLVIIMLGTNDLKNRFSVSTLDVANSVWRLVQAVRSCCYPPTEGVPEVLVVCPPPFAPLEPTPFKEMFVGGEEKSHQLFEAFQAVSKQRDFQLFNAAEVLKSSPLDGIHFEPQEHVKLGRALAAEVRKLIRG
ncbi:MAG: SGNH/GDSL hydrolase family protein [Pontiella sp.]